MPESHAETQTAQIHPLDRAFFNPANAQQYDPDAAKLAWSRTVEFLK